MTAIADYAERLKNTGRNDECPCGSGKKYKRCHMREDEQAEHAALAQQAAEAAAAVAAEKEAGDNEADNGPQHKHEKDPHTAKPQSFKGRQQVRLPRKSQRSGG